ncbi:cytochrome P450 [Mycena floridula]|nr:cytochrome P450 [Mycena floridula]
MSPESTSAILLLVLLLAAVWLLSLRRSRSKLPLPPGPTGSWLFGIKDQLPTSEPWKTYAQWGNHFEESVISFKIYNRRVIVLNDVSSIRNLLDKRASIYSDRPKSWMTELCARGNTVFNISSLGARHKQYRRLIQTGLRPHDYSPVIKEQVETLVQGLIASPKDFEAHFRRSTAAVIMKVAYGYTVRENDAFISVAEESAKITNIAMSPGRWLVDYYPIVRFIPSWLPFAKFKRQAEVWRKRLDHLSQVPHDWVKTQMDAGTYSDSFTSRLLRPDGISQVDKEAEDIIKWCAGGLYVGACDTIVSALMSFVLLMALHPAVQSTAQIELDNVFGHEAPEMSKLGQLRYLPALMKELLRYAPVANFALPHRVIEDDEYHGYHIPKNSTVIANTWAIMHDATLYPSPDEFDPARFLVSQSSATINPDPRAYSFGYGARRCPGIQFAENSLLIHMSSILLRCHIRYPGSIPADFKVEFTSGITSHIKPFEIDISPRNIHI